ncbi:hypothetical protein BJV77DRAFT_1089308 [Russula vinacea]|nr:hypothetical protein BJV77DRAFT_1089308 [Russula vinacea]
MSDIETGAVRNSRVDPKSPKYGDTSATYWKLYASEAEINDMNLVKSLMGNTNSMVLLNSLFSSIVASFIIEIYKTLLPASNGQQTTNGPQVSQFASISYCFSVSS